MAASNQNPIIKREPIFRVGTSAHPMHQPPMKQPQKIISVLLCLLFTVGCSDKIEKTKLAQEERERVLALQNPFGSNLVRLNPAGEHGPVLIGLQNCKVYRAQLEHDVVTEWVRVPEVDGFYPLPSQCNRERIELDGEYVTIEFCKQPMGAGGGCAGGIDPHRSKNGRDWEVSVGKGQWKAVGKAY